MRGNHRVNKINTQKNEEPKPPFLAVWCSLCLRLPSRFLTSSTRTFQTAGLLLRFPHTLNPSRAFNAYLQPCSRLASWCPVSAPVRLSRSHHQTPVPNYTPFIKTTGLISRYPALSFQLHQARRLPSPAVKNIKWHFESKSRELFD